MTKTLIAGLLAAMLALNFGASAAAQENVVSHLEWESPVLVVVVAAKTSDSKVECAAYLDGRPIGSSSAYATAGVATVRILIPESLRNKPGVTAKCP